MQDLYGQNFKTMLRDIKENLDKLRNIPYSWMGRPNTGKILIFPN